METSCHVQLDGTIFSVSRISPCEFRDCAISFNVRYVRTGKKICDYCESDFSRRVHQVGLILVIRRLNKNHSCKACSPLFDHGSNLDSRSMTNVFILLLEEWHIYSLWIVWHLNGWCFSYANLSRLCVLLHNLWLSINSTPTCPYSAVIVSLSETIQNAFYVIV